MRGPAARILGFALAAASLAAAAPAFAAPASSGYDDGLAAYQRNEYAKSLKLLRPLAEHGDARAQYLLGRHYQFGQAVKADRAEAFYWYKRAEAKGHMEAKLFRVLLEKRWKISASEKGRAEQKIAAESAPKAPPRAAQIESKPKPKPEKPAVETAKLRESSSPAAAERAKPAVETARAKLPDPPKAEPTKAKPETAKAKTPDKPALVATRSAPEETTSSVPPAPTVTRERNEAPRPAPRSTVRDDDDDDDAPVRRPNASPPPESRTTIAAVPPPPTTSDDHAPPYPSPGYAPQPNYGPGSPYYAPGPTPYYAPAAPPSWQGPVYYGPRAYYRQTQPWGYRPYAAYMHPGWRGTGWRPRGRW
jgi:hypothetical protein